MNGARDVTALLEAHERGEQGAFDQAVALVYQELRRVAHGQRRRAGRPATLNTTAIVHEAYLKLLGGAASGWRGRGHFLAVAATAMRHVAVDHARSRRRAKRGGDVVHVELNDATPATERQLDDILGVHRVLKRLETTEPELVRVVECRYFAGMTEDEAAAAMAVSVSTVQRLWRAAKARLRDAFGDR